MKIKKALPLELCEKCKDACLFVDEQKVYAGDEIVEQVVTVRCEYASKCKLIYDALKKQMDQEKSEV